MKNKVELRLQNPDTVFHANFFSHLSWSRDLHPHNAWQKQKKAVAIEKTGLIKVQQVEELIKRTPFEQVLAETHPLTRSFIIEELKEGMHLILHTQVGIAQSMFSRVYVK